MRLKVHLAAVAIATIVLASPAARAAMSADDAAAAVADSFGVEVLRVVAADDDGRAVYRVTVMNPGGDFNEAFQVTTIVVDAETGKLVPQFRHLASGHRSSGAPVYDTERQGLDVLSAGIVRR